MILSLVERRSQPEADCWFTAQTDLLERLSAPLGQKEWQVDLVLVDDAVMTGLNEGFRQSEGVTDVLSFSYLEEGQGPGGIAAGQGHAPCPAQPGEEALREGDQPVIGEIIIAPGFVAARCLENGWPVEGVE